MSYFSLINMKVPQSTKRNTETEELLSDSQNFSSSKQNQFVWISRIYKDTICLDNLPEERLSFLPNLATFHWSMCKFHHPQKNKINKKKQKKPETWKLIVTDCRDFSSIQLLSYWWAAVPRICADVSVAIYETRVEARRTRARPPRPATGVRPDCGSAPSALPSSPASSGRTAPPPSRLIRPAAVWQTRTCVKTWEGHTRTFDNVSPLKYTLGTNCVLSEWTVGAFGAIKIPCPLICDSLFPKLFGAQKFVHILN